MPVNRRRGEVEAVFDGQPHRLMLTLGALAELEGAFAVDDLMALAERFEGGRLSAGDAIRILGAGLRGGGAEIDDAEVARLSHEDGAPGFVRAVAALLSATFGAAEAREAGAGAPEPFPWDELTAFGLGVLSLSPKDFWRATPVEIAAAARGFSGGPSAASPLTRADFERLAARFPDLKEVRHGRG